jgi:hypothetical protein
MPRSARILWLARLACLAVLALATPEPAVARPGDHAAPLVHEPIPPDAREDLALRVALDGDLPAAIQTPSGLVSAPDPRQPLPVTGTAYGTTGEDSFAPDRNTKRPEVTGYDEPFTPSTAPFKRLEAYDAVRANYDLYVRDARLTAVPTNSAVTSDDEAFYADLVIVLAPDGNVRIPSVGPGARIVRARLGVGDQDIPFRVVRDGADNWFVQAPSARPGTRARLVMEIAIARATFGGQVADRTWADLPIVPPLPDNVAREAAEVRSAIDVSRAMTPREAVARLVEYFRSFADSDEPPQGRGSVYLDLALSRKGVCRHRAFAFLVTAQSLGIPARMVLNEAHAWVEVHDGNLWRRIDLGGAGRLAAPTSSAIPEKPTHRPPPDAFAWPQNAERGDDMMADARSRFGGGASSPASRAGDADGTDPGGAGREGDSASGAAAASSASARSSDHDDRPAPAVTLRVADANAHRGLPLHVSGEVRADGEPCAHVAVDLWLRDAKTARTLALGTVATGDDGAFADGIVVPAGTPLGDYDIVARSHGSAQCADGSSY